MLQQTSARNWDTSIESKIIYGEFNGILFKMFAFGDLALDNLVVRL